MLQNGIDDEAKSTKCWLQQWRLRHRKRKTRRGYMVKDSRQVHEAIATDSATHLNRGSCLKWKISTSWLSRRLAIVVSCDCKETMTAILLLPSSDQAKMDHWIIELDWD